MVPPAELQAVARNLFFWQAYDAKVRADLCSSAVITQPGIFLVDPIPLSDDATNQLTQKGRVAGIIVTNANHFRASAQFAAVFNVPIYARRESFADHATFGVSEIVDGTHICEGLEVIAIDGAGPGEIALYSSDHAGALIVGDALINVESHGFTFLPRKYCSNQNQMRQSLRRLLDYRFERLLFAHGTPILSRGMARLQELLDSAA
jgi:glyoxylase-like metal-dependent hydrolase (beta-lactamase superfamily II)